MLSPFTDHAAALALLVLALALDVALANIPLLHPLLTAPSREFAAAVAWADRRLNRIEREDSVRRARGLLVVLALGGACVLLALAVVAIAPHLWLARLLELAVMVAGLGLGDALAQAGRVRAAIAEAARLSTARRKGQVPADAPTPEDVIRQAVAPLTTKAVWDMDLHGVLRAALEALVGCFARGVVAPLFWLLVGDLPGLALWLSVRAIADIIGHRTPRYRDFGAAARDALAILDALPARVGVLLLAAACLFLPGTRPRGALAAFRWARGHAEGPAALPMAALAGALSLSLAGPRREGEVTVREGWLGDGRARVTTGDLKPALALLAAASLLAVVLTLLLEVLVA